jgi:polyhydroxyalkanoate synthase
METAKAAVPFTPPPTIAATPKDTIFRDGTASLYRFRPTPGGDADATNIPFLLVPSMINKWYVLDLRPGFSMAESMVEHGIDAYLLDWGTPNDEDRYLNWELIIAKLARMVRRVKRHTGADKVALLGYCMGGTLSSIYTSLHQDDVAAFINLTAPIDFSKGGLLRTLVDEKWFDPYAMTAAGNLPAPQMESGFTSLRPTSKFSKWIMFADKRSKPGFVESFNALEQWAGDNIPFPAEAYQTYIHELYQQNLLYKGEHFVGGKRADLANITCPVLTVVASRDTICPAEAATAMNDLVSSEDQSVLTIGGGHVGAVVGSRAPKQLYPAVAEWLIERFGKDAAPALREVDAEEDAGEELEPMEARTRELEDMTVAQLRRVLRQHDIVTSGNKAELVARIVAHEFGLSGEDE